MLSKFAMSTVKNAVIEIVSYYDIGGQNKIYKGRRSVINPETNEETKMDVILKTAQMDKNQRFLLYLESENNIIQQLEETDGVVRSFGIQQVFNQLTNQNEQHMVLEYCQYGSLHNMSVFTKPYDEPTAYVVIRQIVQALKRVHEKKILHLDIKESNILINFNKENQFKPECGRLPIEFKLADWGVSVDLKNPKSKTNVVYHRGTPKYMAPEQNDSKSVDDPFRVEVYSLGIILFRLIFKAFPFSSDAKTAESEHKNSKFLSEFVNSSKNTAKVMPSSELMHLLQNMLTPNNNKRLTL